MVNVRDQFAVKGDEKNRNEIKERLLREYPFLSCRIIGYSRLNRPIYGLSIGEDHQQALFCGGFHGMEWITCQLLYKFTDILCGAIARCECLSGLKIGRFLSRKGLVIIPCVNPDGVEIAINGSKTAGKYEGLVESVSGRDTDKWQANAAGVDINHNFNADWESVHKLEESMGITGPNPTRYGGTRPESEPETKAIADFCRNNNIRHALAFHSQGEEIYWDFGKNTPVRSKLMANIMSESSGYALSSPQGIAVGGGFKDWFISELKKPAFTIETGKGENPLPIDGLEDIYDKLEEMLTLAAIM